MPVQVWFSVKDGAQKKGNGGAKHALHSLVENLKETLIPKWRHPHAITQC